MTSRTVARVGAQVPPLLVAPPAVASAGSEAVDLAAAAGLDLLPWQRLVLEHALGEREDGTWSAREVGLIVPRQNGKGAVLEALELAAILLFGAREVIHSAHQFKTSKQAYLRMRGILSGSPKLLARVKQFRQSNEDTSIEFRNGAYLRYLTRSKGGGRGFSGDLVVFDEGFNLSAASIADLFPTLSTRPNWSVWYTSTPPPVIDLAAEHSEHLRTLRARAQSDRPGRLAWFEWSTPPESDPDDRDTWYATNPSLGHLIDEEFVETERDTYTDENFRVERLGTWLLSGASSKLPGDAWAAAGRPDAQVSGSDLWFGLDMPPDRSTVWAGVSDGTTSELAAEVGPDELVDWVLERDDRYRPVVWVVDGASPASSFVPDLVAAGVPVEVLGASDFAAACGRLFDDVTAGRFRHRGQAPLNVAAATAASRKLGDRWAWSRSSSAVDISPLVAVTLAHHGAHVLERPAPESPRPVFVH